jgi:hypothetical protein
MVIWRNTYVLRNWQPDLQVSTPMTAGQKKWLLLIVYLQLLTLWFIKVSCHLSGPTEWALFQYTYVI